ncbi:MAG: hypothetical protein QOF26_1108 [Baekduia sp.]|nr:hypothetical protein [Baekduia sp.]
MRRYPAVLWLLIYVGSLLILNGSHPSWRPWQLAVGIALPVIAAALAIYLAAGPWPGHPSVRGSYWLLTGTAAFYGIAALAALLFLGIDEAIAVLLAGIIPMTAVAIWLAHVRQKTAVAPDGALIDAAAEDHTDPIPGLGIDDRRPLGDTPAAHDELIPEDLPKDHPARHAAEAMAETSDAGTTRGHREGGAAAEPGEVGDAGAPVLGAHEEKEGARFGRVEPDGGPDDDARGGRHGRPQDARRTSRR